MREEGEHKVYMVTVRFRLLTDSKPEETKDVVRGWVQGAVGPDRLQDISVSAYRDVLINDRASA